MSDTDCTSELQIDSEADLSERYSECNIHSENDDKTIRVSNESSDASDRHEKKLCEEPNVNKMGNDSLESASVISNGNSNCTISLDDTVNNDSRAALVTSPSVDKQVQTDDMNSSAEAKASSNHHRSKHRSGSRKHRVRHIKKRKWKPYSKLTWAERKRLEERDARRAYRIREQMSAHGMTLAPYNTTQFLMEDHSLQEPDYEHIRHESRHNKENSYDSEDYYSSPDDEADFIQQQFLETYDLEHDAYVNSLPKCKLVEELMRLEDSVELAERSLRELREQVKLLCPEDADIDIEAEWEKVRVFKDEIEKLKHENEALVKKNERLQSILSTKSKIIV